MMSPITEVFYTTYAQAMFIDVPHRARLYPEPLRPRRGRPVIGRLVRSLGRASGRALVRAAAVLEAGGRRLTRTAPNCSDPAVA